MYDVIIIGAGPAGTAAAFDLLRKNYSVLIIDKYQFPRKKACAGGITPKAYNLYQYDISSQIKRVCRTVKVTDKKKQSFNISDSNILCYMTKREDLDLFCLNKTIKNGAEFKIIKKIKSINEEKSHVEVITENNLYKSRFLIGADGANSVVRKLTGMCSTVFKFYALEADVKVNNPLEYKMEFEFPGTKKNYFWIFPKDDHVNIGIYSVQGKKYLNKKNLLDYAKRRLGSDELSKIKGYPLGTGGWQYKEKSNRILLVGDAAGFAEPLLGEGIYFALKSGQCAARSILESDETKKKATSIYQQKISGIKMDLKLYQMNEKWFYNFQGLSLKLLSFKFLHKRFARGFAKGKSLSQILKIPVLFNRFFQ